MDEKRPLFSIVTVTYNSARWVRQAIESVLAQPFADFELLICDDCSQDDTWDIIHSYQDSRIRKYRNGFNIGEYPNRNKALSLAKGHYLLIIDGDDILYKETLVRHAALINYFPDAGGIWGVTAMDIVVFPYQLTPEQITRLNYFLPIPSVL
ncbi:MAG: glycosyltransferase family 2 protein [Sphingobacteriales bacterium]|nr:glycosyltransferase family 2 protein [Sphingobacteriales bacterium]MBI3718033.1 glycosyltransferase family 2 protein [Sphingobacteriales bacterium]